MSKDEIRRYLNLVNETASAAQLVKIASGYGARSDYTADAGSVDKPGMMPWGEPYEIITDPMGQQYLHTRSPGGENDIYCYPNGDKFRILEIAANNPAEQTGDVLYQTSKVDADLYHLLRDHYAEEKLIIGDIQALRYLLSNPSDSDAKRMLIKLLLSRTKSSEQRAAAAMIRTLRHNKIDWPELDAMWRVIHQQG